MQSSLFPETGHNPGGKVKTALPADIKGDADFSECGRYRTVLRRWTGDAFPDRYMMLIGMNPSTADATANDPTITREWGFAQREGFNGFLKCNISDYRATDPKALLALPEGEIMSAANMTGIACFAQMAALVVFCCGKPNRALIPAYEIARQTLASVGVPVYCFGTNSDGSPKHPLYLRADTPLQRCEV